MTWKLISHEEVGFDPTTGGEYPYWIELIGPGEDDEARRNSINLGGACDYMNIVEKVLGNIVEQWERVSNGEDAYHELDYNIKYAKDILSNDVWDRIIQARKARSEHGKADIQTV